MSNFVDNNSYNLTMRYPLKAPISGAETFLGDDATGATGMIDYLKIRRQRTTYREGKYYGANTDYLPNSNATKNQHRSTVYLAIPPGLNAQYQPVYRQVNLGVGGQAALNALESGATDSDSLAAAIRQAASAIRPEFLAGALSQGANAISGFFGVQGNLDANALQGLTTGKVFNPYTEQLFSQMNFRNHAFNIKMMARNYREAKEIKNIIQYLKVGAHPKLSDSGGDIYNILTSQYKDPAASSVANNEDKTLNETQKSDLNKFNQAIGSVSNSGRFFEIPDHYDLDYVRLDPDNVENATVSDVHSSVSTTQTLHYRMQACVCSGINVNYTPDNQYTSFKSVNGQMIQVPAVLLNIQFTEVKLLNQNDILQGF